MIGIKGSKFAGGKLVWTPGVNDLIADEGLNVFTLLGRHFNGDWGDVCAEDARENTFSMRNGFRILSSYDTEHGKVWIITEADRSSTCVLLPEEY